MNSRFYEGGMRRSSSPDTLAVKIESRIAPSAMGNTSSGNGDSGKRIASSFVSGTQATSISSDPTQRSSSGHPWRRPSSAGPLVPATSEIRPTDTTVTVTATAERNDTPSPTGSQTPVILRKSTRPFTQRYHRRFVLAESALDPQSVFSLGGAGSGGSGGTTTPQRGRIRFASCSQLTGDALVKAERVTLRDSLGRPTRLQGYVSTGNPPPQSVLDDGFRLGDRWEFHGPRRSLQDGGATLHREPLRDDGSYFAMFRGEVEEQMAEDAVAEHHQNRIDFIKHETAGARSSPLRGGYRINGMDSIFSRNVAILDADAVGAVDGNGEILHAQPFAGHPDDGSAAINPKQAPSPTIPLSRTAVIKRTVGVHDINFGPTQAPTVRSSFVEQLARSTNRVRSPGVGGSRSTTGGAHSQHAEGSSVVTSPDDTSGFMAPCALCGVIFSKKALKFYTTAKNIVRLHSEWHTRDAEDVEAHRRAAELSAMMWTSAITCTASGISSNGGDPSSRRTHSPKAGRAATSPAPGGGGVPLDEDLIDVLMVSSPRISSCGLSPKHGAASPPPPQRLGVNRLAGLNERVSVSFLGTPSTKAGHGVSTTPAPAVQGDPSSSRSQSTATQQNSQRHLSAVSPTYSSPASSGFSTGQAKRDSTAANMYAPVRVCTFCGQFFGLYEGMCGGPQTLEEVNALLIKECRHLKQNRVERVRRSREENQNANAKLRTEVMALMGGQGDSRFGLPAKGGPTLSVTATQTNPPEHAATQTHLPGSVGTQTMARSVTAGAGRTSLEEGSVLTTIGVLPVADTDADHHDSEPPRTSPRHGLRFEVPSTPRDVGEGNGCGEWGQPVAEGASPLLGASFSARASRSASMRSEGLGKSGRFKAVARSVFATMTLLGKSARGDTDFSKIRGGTFGMSALQEGRGPQVKAGSRSSSIRVDAAVKRTKGRLSEAERDELVLAFFAEGAPSMRIDVQEPPSPVPTPRATHRGTAVKAAQKWRHQTSVGRSSRSRSGSLCAATEVTSAYQNTKSVAKKLSTSIGRATDSPVLTSASPSAPGDLLATQPTMVCINSLRSSSQMEEIDEHALSIISNQPSELRAAPNDVSLHAQNPSSFASSALDGSGIVTGTGSRSNIVSPDARNPSARRLPQTAQSERHPKSIKIFAKNKMRKQLAATSSSGGPVVVGFEKECQLLRSGQDTRNQRYLAQREQRRLGAVPGEGGFVSPIRKRGGDSEPRPSHNRRPSVSIKFEL